MAKVIYYPRGGGEPIIWETRPHRTSIQSALKDVLDQSVRSALFNEKKP